MRNPLRTRSKTDRARDRAVVALEALREAAETVRDQSDTTLRSLSEPVPDKGRGPARLVVGVGVVAAVGYALKRLFGSSSTPGPDFSGTPSPAGAGDDLSPTAPMGPTDERLNDPALKAKIESEVFDDDELPKGEVAIDVSGGVATLRGTVSDDETQSRIVARVEEVDGVRRVESLLESSG